MTVASSAIKLARRMSEVLFKMDEQAFKGAGGHKLCDLMNVNLKLEMSLREREGEKQ